jgi:hypothetical protein
MDMFQQVDTTTWNVELPSWILDWTACSSYTPWLAYQNEPGRVVYKAAGDSSGAMTKEMGNKLILEGFVIIRSTALGKIIEACIMSNTVPEQRLQEYILAFRNHLK